MTTNSCRRAFLPALALIALCALAGPARTADAPTAAALPVAAPDLRVMSFNLRYATAPDGDNAWDRRRDLLAETIRAFGPDVLGTQECLAEQAAFLQAALPGYAWVGVGRDDGKLAGEMCAVFYREDRFVPAGQGTFWLSETPDVAGSRGWDAALPRIATWVRLRERSDSTQAFVFVDTHFDHLGAEARTASGRLLRQRLQALAGKAPVVIVGDFNAPADAALPGPYAALVDTAAAGGLILRDAYRALHAPAPGEGTFHGFGGGRDGQRIDWVLATPAWAPVAAEIDRTAREGRLPSDHFPMTAVLRRPPRAH